MDSISKRNDFPSFNSKVFGQQYKDAIFSSIFTNKSEASPIVKILYYTPQIANYEANSWSFWIYWTSSIVADVTESLVIMGLYHKIQREVGTWLTGGGGGRRGGWSPSSRLCLQPKHPNINNKKVQFVLLIKFTPGTLERWSNLYFGQKWQLGLLRDNTIWTSDRKDNWAPWEIVQ